MPKPVVYAGVAQVDITPPMGVEMCGYGPYEKRVCTDVLDPLYARSLWLQCGEERLLIVTLDLCSVCAEVRDDVVQQVCHEVGLSQESVLIAASHTHSGPSTQRLIGWGERDAPYLGELRQRLVKACLEARAEAVPARMGACRQRVHGVGVNREQPAFGLLDTAAQLLRVDRADGTPLAVLYNFAAHGVVRYPFTSRVSADWPGLAAAYIKASLGTEVVLFLQGCGGNINAHEMSFARDDVVMRQQVADMRTGDVAIRLCDQILPALRGIRTSSEAELCSVWRTVKLPCSPPDAEDLRRVIAENQTPADRMTLAELRPLHERIRDESEQEREWRFARYRVDAASHQLGLLEKRQTHVEAPVQIMRLGEAVLVGWPGEIYVELGLEIRQRSPFPLTFVAGFANDTVGYIPTPAAYESQGKANEFGKYPTTLTPQIYGNLPFRGDVGRVLVEDTLDLLNQLHSPR